MAIIGQGISLRGMVQEEFNYPFYMAAGITVTEVGLAVSLDATAANTAKLAAAGEQIMGRLAVVENRSVEGVVVGTVELKGGFAFTEVAAPAFALAVGDTVIGAGAGLVKARLNAGATAKESNLSDNMVVEVIGTTIIVVVR